MSNSWAKPGYLQEMHQNQRQMEIYNLYLDMNQIVHKCAQSYENQPPKNEEEIIELVFKYLDWIFSIIWPRQLLYMAIDGVTPRARMTHQRSKRFLKSKNIFVGVTNDQDQTVTTTKFDKCKIKPGTEFMSKLSDCLRYYIYNRMNTREDWGSIKVILSDANVPGEGEHKIMDFIRRQREQPDYDSDTHHVVYSSDSDLILLGLATHEHHFSIICEGCDNCGKIGHGAKECKHKTQEECGQRNKLPLTTSNNIEKKIRIVYLSKLRERICEELKMKPKSKQAIDDWIFVCLLLGNDFLPSLPSIDRPEHSMDILIRRYKSSMSVLNKHLTKNGIANLKRVEKFFKNIGDEENSIFIRRHERDRQEGGDDIDRNDTIRLWEYGQRERYYTNKFNISQDNLKEFSTKVAHDYTLGLCWILQYYYQGVPSWDWYYPYHYGPFATDFSNLNNVPVNFTKNTKPFSPLEQMIATFSPQDAKYLPIQWRQLMLDKNSPIIDFYPTVFKIDPNGKRKKSQGVALLPFVDEKRLLRTLELVYSTLTPEEEKRNKRDYDSLFVHSTNSCYKQFENLYGDNRNETTQNNPIKLSNGMAGEIWPDNEEKIKDIGTEIIAPIPNYENIPNNQVICVKYRDPQFPDGHIFKAKKK